MAERCTHRYKDTPKNREAGRVGDQCGFHTANDTPFCKFHGGNNARTIEQAQRERFVAEIRAAEPGFTDMWAEDHDLLDPFSILMWEIRRSGARVEWFDRRLAELKEAKDLWWGMVKQEKIGATEFAGTNATYEAKENVILKLQNDERKRLMDLRKQWQDDRFEAARVAGMGAFGAASRAMIRALFDEFDLDLMDPEIQARVQRALEGLPDPIPGMNALAPSEQEKQRVPR